MLVLCSFPILLKILTVVANFRRRTNHHLPGEPMHGATAVHLKAIVVLQIVNQQLSGGQQMEFAVCELEWNAFRMQFSSLHVLHWPRHMACGALCIGRKQCIRYAIANIQFRITSLQGWIYVEGWLLHPGHHSNQLFDKRGNDATQNRCAASRCAQHFNVHFVRLSDHYGGRHVHERLYVDILLAFFDTERATTAKATHLLALVHRVRLSGPLHSRPHTDTRYCEYPVDMLPPGTASGPVCRCGVRVARHPRHRPMCRRRTASRWSAVDCPMRSSPASRPTSWRILCVAVAP